MFCGLKVSVHDAHRVRDRERVEQLLHQGHRLLEREPPLFAQRLGERPALHERHHDVRALLGPVFDHAEVKDRDDRRVVDRREQPRFALKSLAQRGVVAQVCVQDFHRDGPPEAKVRRAPDRSHTAATDELFEPVVFSDDDARLELQLTIAGEDRTKTRSQ